MAFLTVRVGLPSLFSHSGRSLEVIEGISASVSDQARGTDKEPLHTEHLNRVSLTGTLGDLQDFRARREPSSCSNWVVSSDLSRFK